MPSRQVWWKEKETISGVDAISPQVFTLETLIVLNNKDVSVWMPVKNGLCLGPCLPGYLSEIGGAWCFSQHAKLLTPILWCLLSWKKCLVKLVSLICTRCWLAGEARAWSWVAGKFPLLREMWRLLIEWQVPVKLSQFAHNQGVFLHLELKSYVWSQGFKLSNHYILASCCHIVCADGLLGMTTSAIYQEWGSGMPFGLPSDGA